MYMYILQSHSYIYIYIYIYKTLPGIERGFSEVDDAVESKNKQISVGSKAGGPGRNGLGCFQHPPGPH